MSRNPASRGSIRRKLALAVGFLSVASATLVAYGSPASGYEVSIYAATPTWVWAGLVVGMSVALIAAFAPIGRNDRGFAILLGGVTMVAFAGLPIVRNYRFVGHYDALTHLGWARAINDATMSPFELFYPGIHTATVMIHSTIGLPLAQSMLLVVLLTVIVFFVFVPLCAGVVAESRRAATIGAFGAFLLLPITTIAINVSAHAMSQAVMLSTILVYLFTKYVRSRPQTASFAAISTAFAVVSIALIVYHPQLVAHLIVFFVAVSILQFLAGAISTPTRVGSQPTMYGQTVFLIVIFLLWSAPHGFFSGMLEHFLGAAVEFLFADGSAGDSVTTQGASLSAIGGSLLEIFLKLFVPQLVFSLLAVGLVVWTLVSGSDWIGRVRAETGYFLVGLVGLGGLFFIYFVAPGSTMYFRVFGLIMVIVTIMGAVALHGLGSDPDDAGFRRAAPSRRPLLAAGFAVLLTLSLVAVFPSPYIYNASPHVSDQQMEGYQSAFDTQAEDVQFVGLRDAPNRYDDAVNGNHDRSYVHGDLNESAPVEELRESSDDQYLVLTQLDYEREVIAYGELRYSESELDAVRSAEGVNRIQTNGEFERYYVHGSEPVGT